MSGPLGGAPLSGDIYDADYDAFGFDVEGGNVRFYPDRVHHTVYGGGYHVSWDEYEAGGVGGQHVTDHSDGSITGF